MFLAKNIIGIDVNDTTIRMVQLNGEKSLLAATSHSLPEGVVKNGEIINEKAFVIACQKALLETKSTDENSLFLAPEGIVSLPEGEAWSYTVSIPTNLTEAERVAFVFQEAEKIIPHDLSTFYTRVEVVQIQDQWFGVFVAAPKKLVDSLYQCFLKAGIRVSFIGSNFYSIARAVLPKEFGENNYSIVDIGSRQTTVGVFDERAVPYIVVSSAYYDEKPDTLSKILKDILEVHTYFNKKSGQVVTHTIVTGQRDSLEQIAEQLKEKVEGEVDVGDPFRYLSDTSDIKKQPFKAGFANSIGLALYGVDRTLPHINLLPEKNAKTHLWQHHMLIKVTAIITTISQRVAPYAPAQHKPSRKTLVMVFFVVLALLLLAYVLMQYL